MSDRNLQHNPKTVACPTCKSSVTEEAQTFPFCSSRCKTIDLGRWFDESFKISRPIEQADLEEDD